MNEVKKLMKGLKEPGNFWKCMIVFQLFYLALFTGVYLLCIEKNSSVTEFNFIGYVIWISVTGFILFQITLYCGTSVARQKFCYLPVSRKAFIMYKGKRVFESCVLTATSVTLSVLIGNNIIKVSDNISLIIICGILYTVITAIWSFFTYLICDMDYQAIIITTVLTVIPVVFVWIVNKAGIGLTKAGVVLFLAMLIALVVCLFKCFTGRDFFTTSSLE